MGERPWNSWNSRQAVLSRPRVSPKSLLFFSGTTMSPALNIMEMSCMKKKDMPVAARSRAPALEIAQAAMPTAPQASRVPSTVQARLEERRVGKECGPYNEMTEYMYTELLYE